MAGVVDQSGLLYQPSGTGTVPQQATINGNNELRVNIEGANLFVDTFDTAFDTTTNWTSGTVNGGIAASLVANGGGITLGSSTTASGASWIVTKLPGPFRTVPPAFLVYGYRIQLTNPLPANSFAFWGATGTTVPGTPTTAAPILDGVGLEITTGGKLQAVSYQLGAGRVLIADLSSTGNNKQPLDGGTYTYYQYFRGDKFYWALTDQDNIIATGTGANGPNINAMRPLVMAIASSTPPTTSLTVTVPAVFVGDNGHNGNIITDGSNPWLKGVVKIGTTQPLGSDTPFVVALSPNSVNVSVMPNAAIVTPALTTTNAYTATQSIGGILTFTGVLGAFNAGIVQSITAKFRGEAQTSALSVSLFKASPSVGTYTDHVAVASNTADIANLLGTYRMATAFNDIGTMGVYVLDGINKAVVGGTSNLYGVVTSVTTSVAMGSTSDFSMEVVVLPS